MRSTSAASRRPHRGEDWVDGGRYLAGASTISTQVAWFGKLADGREVQLVPRCR
jgi:hypothetical protein